METKEIKITPPVGYEIDKEDSTFECIKFKKKESLTYEDVAKALFFDEDCYRAVDLGVIKHFYCAGVAFSYPNNATSEKQLKKLLAINKLLNVSVFLNDGWIPDWDNVQEDKWFIQYRGDSGIRAGKHNTSQIAPVYFKTEERVYQAVDILGEGTIRLALSTDW